MTQGVVWLAACVVSLVQKSLNGAVWNSTLMLGYFWVTMSAMWSQAFFSTSEPDHMNQVIVTGPPEAPPEPLFVPPLLLQAARRTTAAAAARALVRRGNRMALLTLDVVVRAEAGSSSGAVSRTRPRMSDRRPHDRGCQRSEDNWCASVPEPRRHQAISKLRTADTPLRWKTLRPTMATEIRGLPA